MIGPFTAVAWLVPTLFAGPAALAAQDGGPAADGRVALEAELDPPEPYAGEPFLLRLRLVVERDFLAQGLVQPTLRELGVPALLSTGAGDDPRLEVLGDGDGDGDGAGTLGLDGEVVEAVRREDRLADGRELAVFEVVRRLRASEPEAVAGLEPEAFLVWSDGFTEDLFGGRRPTSRHELRLRPAGFEPRGRALPVEGRPDGFAGAVGRFELEVGGPEPAAVEVDGTFRVEVLVRAAQPHQLDPVTAPHARLGQAYHLLGALERRTEAGLEVTYELVALEPAPTAGPRFELAAFEPGAGYRTLSVEAPPPTVAGAPRPSGSSSDPPRPAPDDGGAAGGLAVPLAAAVAALAVLVAVARRRRGHRAPVDPVAARARAAAEDARARAGDWAALVAYLRVRPGLPPGVEDGVGLAPVLAAAGVGEDLARRAEAGLRAATAARFGGGAPPANGAELLEELVRELDAGVPD